MFTFLTRIFSLECGLYLSSMNTMTIWHLRDLAAGKRLKIKAKDVAEIHIPNFEGLTTADLLEFGMKYE